MDRDEPGWVDRALAGGVGGVAGAALVGAGVDPGAAVIITPLITEALIAFGADLNRRRVERVAELWAETARRLDVPDADLAEKADTDSKAQLLGQALIAGANARTSEKIASLARVLADGLEGDEVKVDTASLLTAALADMEVPHIRVLAYLAGPHLTNPPVPGYATPRTLVEFLDANQGHAVAIAAIVSVLEFRGLIRVTGEPAKDLAWVTAYPGSSQIADQYAVTVFGFELLTYLLDAGALESANERSGGEFS